MSEDAAVADAVRRFVADRLRVPLARLTEASRLFHDLGCDGDDAIELIEGYAREFGVDVRGIQLSRYFGPEAAFVPGADLLRKVLGRASSTRPLTIGDLIAGARAGVLEPAD